MSSISIYQALSDPLVEEIKGTIDIIDIGDVYNVINLPNLIKAKFHIQPYLRGDSIVELYAECVDQYPDIEEYFPMWITCIYPILKHYCDGIYMINNRFTRHHRFLKGTDFTFQWKKEDKLISITYSYHQISITTYDHDHKYSMAVYNGDDKNTGDDNNNSLTYKAKSMFESIEVLIED